MTKFRPRQERIVRVLDGWEVEMVAGRSNYYRGGEKQLAMRGI